MEPRLTHRPHTLALGLAALALWLGAATARAEGGPASSGARISDRGRVLLSGSVGGSWSNDSRVYAPLDHWNVYANPAATYFLRDRIGLGLALSGGARARNTLYSSYRDSHFTLGVEAVFEVPLGPRLGFLLRPFVGYLRQWREVSGPAGKRELGYVRTWISSHLLVQLSSSVALTAGPDLWIDFLVSEDQRRSYELSEEPPLRVQVGLSVGLLIAL